MNKDILLQQLKELFYKVQKGYHPSRATKDADNILGYFTNEQTGKYNNPNLTFDAEYGLCYIKFAEGTWFKTKTLLKEPALIIADMDEEDRLLGLEVIL